jgi:hypothetical protein
MSEGYGRGYYGSGQLNRPPSGSGRGWLIGLAVVGIGAAAWYFWPRKTMPVTAMQQPFAPYPPNEDELGRLARARGYASVAAFEDAVIATARELRKSGAEVRLSPPLQHLESRLES